MRVVANEAIQGTGRNRVVCLGTQHLIGDGMARELNMSKWLDPMSLELVALKTSSGCIWFPLS